MPIFQKSLQGPTLLNSSMSLIFLVRSNSLLLTPVFNSSKEARPFVSTVSCTPVSVFWMGSEDTTKRGWSGKVSLRVLVPVGFHWFLLQLMLSSTLVDRSMREANYIWVCYKSPFNFRYFSYLQLHCDNYNPSDTHFHFGPLWRNTAYLMECFITSCS